MCKNLLLSLFIIVITFSSIAQKADLNYSVNLNDRSNDTFKVTLKINKLTEANNIYQFASTAPGTYQTMNIGRYVSNFKALDKKGREIPTENISVNQWKISNPTKVKSITYEIAETWDTPVEEYMVYKMCGTSMEDDHVLMNAHCIFGFPSGMQNSPLTIDLSYPETWKVGTALNKNEAGVYYAKNYDFAVDSPILLGRLTYASTDLDGNPVEIYTYSKTDLISSEMLLNSMKSMLTAAGEFMIDFPVDRYTFLYHFEDEGWGAWEHSYSSEYVQQEQPYTPEYAKGLTDMAAHEFFHVVTPLNIHSEIIQNFNFETPTPSEHLWLYEGTTEWAAHMMQLRNGLTSLDDYLKTLQEKVEYDSYYDPNFSLSKLALTSFTKEGNKEYGNIYARGALVAGLLDIKLLELSGGKKGYREYIYDLSKMYGPEKAFSEKGFFDEFTNMTYPEMGDFFNKYVKNAEPLPFEEYYKKIGITYIPEISTGQVIPDVGAHLGVPDGKIRFLQIRPELEAAGLKANDIFFKFKGREITLSNVNQLLSGVGTLVPGTEYNITVLRDEKEIDLTLTILSKPEIKKYVFELNKDASPEQLKLREAWMKNQ